MGSAVCTNGSVWADIKAAGIPFDNHESDLYLPDTAEVRAIARKHGATFTMFRNQVNGEMWLDFAFLYLPWWEARAK